MVIISWLLPYVLSITVLHILGIRIFNIIILLHTIIRFIVLMKILPDPPSRQSTIGTLMMMARHMATTCHCSLSAHALVITFVFLYSLGQLPAFQFEGSHCGRHSPHPQTILTYVFVWYLGKLESRRVLPQMSVSNKLHAQHLDHIQHPNIPL